MRGVAGVLAIAALYALVAALLPLADAFGQETITTLAPIAMSTTTGEKPQSKVWRHDGRWWAVLASDDVSPPGTWLWRLESNNQWTNVLRLSSSTSARADVRSVGDVAHILLHSGSGRLVSVEYQRARQTYVPWSQRTTATSISLSSSETATLDVDSTGRMWLATDSSSSILVYYSDPPYAAFKGPVSLARGTTSDDIAVVTAMPLPGVPSIGVLWSNQDEQRFGFRLHVDGMDPLTWLADEVPGDASARDAGGGMADDHLHVATASDGTLYAAVKTSYNDGESGNPQIGLLRRRPGGTWDGLYTVDNEGTRGIVVLNEPANLVRVIYRDDGPDDIVYRDSPTTNIRFGSRKTLIDGPLNDPTSTKDNWTTELVVISDGKGVLIRRQTTTTTTTTTTSTTTTTLPPGVRAVEVRVSTDSDDAEEAPEGDVDLGSADLELVDDGGLQTVGIRFQGVAVPRFATIRNAWVQFQVDEVSSGPTALTVRGQASDQTATFTSAARNVSARPTTATAVPWSPPAWPTEGVAGPAQRTPGLAGIIQEIVNRPGWASGNALVLVVTGNGHRVARSHDGLPAGAPLLRVEYSIPSTTTTITTTTSTTTTSTTTTTTSTTSTTTTSTTSTTTTSTTVTTTTTTTEPIPTTTTTTLIPGVITVQVRVAGASDDAEEAESGAVELASGDLELVDDGGLQTVGLRFAGVTVPRGVTIRDAFVQFEVDEPTSQATSLTIAGQATDRAASFTTAAGNVSARPRTTATVSWSPAAWPAEGAAGAAERTPSLATVIQEIVSRTGWTSGNALALIITGEGRRVARSFDGQPDGAPRLRIDYDLASIPTTTVTSTSVTTTSITTTTLPACSTLRCVLETAEAGPSCAGQSLSTKVTRKLARTLAQAEAAPSATPRKATQRYTHAKRLLRQVGKAIESATRRRRPKLSVACAADLRAAVQTGIGLIDEALAARTEPRESVASSRRRPD